MEPGSKPLLVGELGQSLERPEHRVLQEVLRLVAHPAAQTAEDARAFAGQEGREGPAGASRRHGGRGRHDAALLGWRAFAMTETELEVMAAAANIVQGSRLKVGSGPRRPGTASPYLPRPSSGWSPDSSFTWPPLRVGGGGAHVPVPGRTLHKYELERMASTHGGSYTPWKNHSGSPRAPPFAEGRSPRSPPAYRGAARRFSPGDRRRSVLHQLSATQGALGRVVSIVLSNHIDTCVREAFESGEQRRHDRMISELMAVFERYARSGPRVQT